MENIKPIVSAVGGEAMEYLSLFVDEIAVHLGKKRDTVYRWIHKFGVLAHRMGRLSL